MNCSRYLERIGYAGPVRPSTDVLKALQRHHLFHVPFENLDIIHQIPLHPEDSYEKIVVQKRGGFCYELNGLFADLLQSIGFDVTIISARVYTDAGGYSPEFDHMALLVKQQEGTFLADAGFGDFAHEPLPLITDKDLMDPSGIYKMIQADDAGYIVQRKNEAGMYKPEYRFTETKRQAADFLERCLYHQISPASAFTQKRLATLPVPGGRITLTGNTLKKTLHGKINTEELPDEAAVHNALQHYFGILIS